MLKKNLTFLFIYVFCILVFWQADKTSAISINWRSFEFNASSLVILFAVMALIIFIMLINFVLHKTIEKQLRESRYMAKNKNYCGDEETIVLNRKEVNESMMLLVDSMISITEGDMQRARKYLSDLEKIIGNDTIIDILRLKIYKGEKNFDKMEELSAKLENNPNLRLVSFKADIEAKMQKKQFGDALKTANKAFELRQDLYWVIESAFKLRIKAGDWDGALQVLNSGFNKGLIKKDKYEKFKAVVLYEIAKNAKDGGDNVNFFKFCSQAIESSPDFVSASILMAEYYMENDKQVRKAAKVLSKIWRLNPTTEIAEAYLNLWPEDDVVERVQRMETLALTNGKNPSVNNLILADLYCKAKLWTKAKSEFEIFLINNPATKKLAKTIAYYEKYANANEKAAANWKKKATECMSDSIWVCANCGHTSTKWHPYCKKCDEVASFNWQLFAKKDN